LIRDPQAREEVAFDIEPVLDECLSKELRVLRREGLPERVAVTDDDGEGAIGITDPAFGTIPEPVTNPRLGNAKDSLQNRCSGFNL